MRSTDTIFAAASGQGRAAITVIRLSGPAARSALEALTAGRVPPPRVASLRRLRDPGTDEILDEGLVLWMPAPGSFTGEDGAELHLHGGVATRAAVAMTLARLPGLRPAEPGEFTRRAFLAGRMDLSAVEGLADLIDAETEAQQRQALRQMGGALARTVARWRERLIDVAALLEAGLDFSDEEDVPDDLRAEIRTGLEALEADIRAEIARSSSAERLREGLCVVIAGAPNAGKSTLLNALARRDVAIVSPQPGTTRDAIEVRCDLGGLPVTFVDTAGIRDSSDPVEQEGVRRARLRAGEADLVLWLRAPDVLDDIAPLGPETVEVWTKADVADGAGLRICAPTGLGMPALLAELADRAERLLAGAADAVITRERHRLALLDTVSAIGRGLLALDDEAEELAAEDVRLASRSLGRITGQVDVEEILDRVFGQFCIGK